MMPMTKPTGIGVALRRKEDFRFVTGRGSYVADAEASGHDFRHLRSFAACTRRLLAIDTTAALAIPGVHRGADRSRSASADGVGGMPFGWGITGKDGLPMKEPPHPAHGA